LLCIDGGNHYISLVDVQSDETLDFLRHRQPLSCYHEDNNRRVVGADVCCIHRCGLGLVNHPMRAFRTGAPNNLRACRKRLPNSRCGASPMPHATGISTLARQRQVEPTRRHASPQTEALRRTSPPGLFILTTSLVPMNRCKCVFQACGGAIDNEPRPWRRAGPIASGRSVTACSFLLSRMAVSARDHRCFRGRGQRVPCSPNYPSFPVAPPSVR
jgi:hypothetical protein